MTAKVFMIPAGTNFAAEFVRGFAARYGADDPLAHADASIYVPTRRAVATLRDAFAATLGGAAILPAIRPLGDVDEEALVFDPGAEPLDLPPAIPPTRRRLLLAHLIREWQAKRDPATQMTVAQAAGLAGALAGFLDETQTLGVALDGIAALAPANLAEHWNEVAAFLDILASSWPKLLIAEGAEDPANRRNALLRALAGSLARAMPRVPVIAAGSTGSIPATAELLQVIVGLPRGAAVLPGLDREMDDASWDTLDTGHPQYGLKQLLARLGVARGDVAPWTETAPPPRLHFLREALRPPPTTDAWRRLADAKSDKQALGLDGLELIEAEHPAEEAKAIAVVLRELLEAPDKTAALVTPDRALARRVAAEMMRWNIAIDDSAGRPLSHTPPGTFLGLAADAATAEFAPVEFLALLKHPLAAGGMAPAVFRSQVRALETAILRGPRPDPGLEGLRRALAASNAERNLRAWFARLAQLLDPLAVLAREVPLADAVAAHARAAEALAATDTEDSSRMWRGEAGEAAARFLAELAGAGAALPVLEAGSYAALFRRLAEERPVRPRYGQHPRVFILGPLEARLQSFDLVILGGLNEGTWPAPAPIDPWLSRPMRNKLGLEAPERRIGLAAHDFAVLAAGPRVVMTRAQRDEGAPTVPSRWLQRIVQLAAGLGLADALRSPRNYRRLAHSLDRHEAPARHAARPAPAPPRHLRPRSLSVTEIETLIRDPYAIYAKHVLRLRPLDPVDAEVGPRERGSAVHAALEKFLKAYPDGLPDDAETRLAELLDHAFAASRAPAAARALWQPRFRRFARWFVGQEGARRGSIARSHVEIRGEAVLEDGFRLRGIADRIDILMDGTAAIIDYKTGQPPSQKKVKALVSPQLPLEAAMLRRGGFAGIAAVQASQLIYITAAGNDGGRLIEVKTDAAALGEESLADLSRRVAYYGDAQIPYLPRVMPERTDLPGDYDHLARVREWSAYGEREEGEE